MRITYEYYIWLMSLGIPYDGEVEMPDGTILYSFHNKIVVPPIHQYIYNPPRYANRSDDEFVYIDECTLVLPLKQLGQQQKEINIEATSARLYNKVVRQNANGTISVNMGYGKTITVPQYGSEIIVSVNANDYFNGEQTNTFSIDIVSVAGNLRESLKMKLADTDAVYSISDMAPNDDPNNMSWMKGISTGLTAAGLALSGIEQTAGVTTYRTHRLGGTKFSPKLYRSGWKGGSRSMIKTHSLTKTAKVAGKVFFGLGVIWELVSLFGGQQSLAKTTVNITFSSIATFGGVPGLIIGVFYFGLDAFGMFDGGYTPSFEPIRWDMSLGWRTVPADKTRIMQPIYVIDSVCNNIPVLDSANLQQLLLDE